MGTFLDVGLTGGICCGKSTVLRLFATLGYFTLDADEIYHKLIERGAPIYWKLIEWLGDDILDGRKRIDRVRLGEIVFNSLEALRQLNAIAHPLVVDDQERLKAEIKARESGGIIITDAALMIEAGTFKHYDKLIVVYCDPDQQLDRLMRRAGLGRERALERIGSQMPIDEKLEYADYVIRNTDSIEALKRQVEDLHNYLTLDLRAKEKSERGGQDVRG